MTQHRTGRLVSRRAAQAWGLAGFVLRRQRHRPGLTLLALVRIILAISLVTSSPVFSQAVDQVLLQRELSAFSQATGRPPFSTAVYVFPSASQPLSLEGAEELSDHIAGTLSSEVGLPLRHLGMRVTSGSMMLQPSGETDQYGEERKHLRSVELVYVAEVADRLEITAGQPYDADGASGDALDVWMHARAAGDMGVQPGEELNVSVTLLSEPTPVRVAGFWQARDREDEFWFKDPDMDLKDALLVRRRDYIERVQPILAAKTRAVHWYIILDESKVIPADAPEYIAGFERSLAIIDRYAPGVRLNTPPLDPLGDFVHQETTLTAILLSYSLPALGFVLYFLALTSSIVAAGQQTETSALISRGAGTSGVVAVTVIDELFLLVVGCPLGVGLGILLAWLMGHTVSFMSFTSRPALPLSLRGLNVPLIVLGLTIALVARLLPVVAASRESVADLEQQRLRPVLGPFWHRYCLDLLLLVPTAYAYRQLVRTGSLASLVGDRGADLYRDPLLILVPGLFILAAALLAMRVFPLLMRAADRLAGVTPSTTVHLALRQLGRQSQSYISPLLLVIVALALGIYSYSLAASLDQWLVDRLYYRVGADLTFTPVPEDGQEPETFGGAWIPIPEEFTELPGVVGATTVGDHPMEIRLDAGRGVRGRFLAIDRVHFPSVAWYRPDFSGETLGALMNRLALAPENILVSQSSLDQAFLRVGDQVHMRIVVESEQEVSSLFTVAGTFDYFPTVYEEESVAVVGNLDYLSTLVGVTAPHGIWLRLEEEMDGSTVLRQLPRTGVVAGQQRDTRALISEARADLGRVGVFGTLSVGFAASVFMAAVGLLVYSYASLRERVYRLSVLRAVGLTYGQIIGQVVLEYGVLTVYGAAVGAGIGAGASQFFAPFFTITCEKRVPLPPLIPIIARGEVGMLAGAFALMMVAIAAIVIATTLSRRRFGLLRMGR